MYACLQFDNHLTILYNPVTFTQLLWALIGGQRSCDGDKIRKRMEGISDEHSDVDHFFH